MFNHLSKKMHHNIDYIKKQIRLAYQKINLSLKDIANDYMVNAIYQLQSGNYRAAYQIVCQLYKLSNTPEEQAVTLFHKLLFAEDVVTKDSVIFIHNKSPYIKSLKKLAKELGFTIQEHNLHPSCWTKDYMVAIRDKLILPVKDKTEEYLTSDVIKRAKTNPQLYYGALNMNEHHRSKDNISTPKEWKQFSRSTIEESILTRKIVLEGGNCFFAINKYGKRFALIGENVVSETMAYNKETREAALKLICQELSCPEKYLLVIPQWTYHLDLQMAYLGKGQFIIHSFNQKDINFALSQSELAKIRTTFEFLEEKFEVSIIDKAMSILKENGFEANKVFGCLFALDNINDHEQQKYVPYCKSSDGFDGVYALMMNGITIDLGTNKRYFTVARSDMADFKEQFTKNLKKLGITEIREVDMLDAYDYDGEFYGITLGIIGAYSVTQIVAIMHGALRCQTSILSQSLSKEHTPELSRHNFFKRMEYLDLDQHQQTTAIPITDSMTPVAGES